MNWEAAGVVAEIVGAVAVVVSLLFLAIEVRRGRNATESASVDSLAEGFNTLNAHLMGDPGLASVYLKGMSAPESLDEVEAIRFVAMGQSYINHFTTVMKYHDAGLLPQEEWLSHYHAMHHIFNSPGGKWIQKRITMTPTLRAAFEAAVPPQVDDGFWFAPHSSGLETAPNKSLESDA